MISFELRRQPHGRREGRARLGGAGRSQPKIHDLDREHRFERGFLKGMADLHLLGICIPEEYGGAGMDYLSLGIACEELEYVDTHLRVIMSVHVGLNSHDPHDLGDRGAEEEVPGAAGQGREDRHLRPDRAQRGLGRRRDPDDGR